MQKFQSMGTHPSLIHTIQQTTKPLSGQVLTIEDETPVQTDDRTLADKIIDAYNTFVTPTGNSYDEPKADIPWYKNKAVRTALLISGGVSVVVYTLGAYVLTSKTAKRRRRN